MLLPPLLAGAALLCSLLAIAISFGQPKANNPLTAEQPQPTHDEIARQLTLDLEGSLTPGDIRRAQKPLSERRRLLHAHPYFALYKIAKRRFGVSWYLVAAVHYQDTGFGEAPRSLARERHWQRHRDATKNILRPTSYPNRTARHPSVKDDFDVVMAIAASLKAHGARNLGEDAQRAVAARYGTDPAGRLATAMVIERARAWRLLGTLPLPGSGELATPTRGVFGGCGYFGCPRPGHLHNGVDFLAPTGTPIHAADGGVVATVESPGQSGGYGNFVCIQHRPRLATCYAHMSAFAAAIRPGARVRRGQVIGLVGSTGRSTAPHLHFEVRRGPAACSACAVDPHPMLSGDVPDAALPAMTNATAGSQSAASGIPLAPALSAPARPETDAQSGGAVPATPAPRASGRARPPRGEPTTGGAVPGEATAPRPTPAPQPGRPEGPAPQPAPPAPQPDTGTGGAVPTSSEPAPPPPGPLLPEEPASPPSNGSG